LIFLFPNIETKEDIKQYINSFYQNNWILFFETENLEVVKYVHRIPGKIIKSLGVNPILNPEDGHRFVDARLSILNEEGIIFEENALKEYIISSAKRGGASIREIETVCERAYNDAVENHKKFIKFTDIAKIAISKFKV